MTGEVRERPKVNLDDDDLDLSDFGVPKQEPETSPVEPTAAQVKEVSEKAGFPSRSAKKPAQRRNRGRRKLSPFQDQIGIKCRTDMKELFQDLGDELGTYDHTTFERAIHALIVESGNKSLLARYEKITKND